MNGYSPQLPLRLDKTDGAYALNQTLKETVRQNFKMLILTNPGEKVMDPNFGVGLRRLLFENDDNNLRSKIVDNINSQTKKYLNFINILDISINEPNTNDNNALYVLILYRISGFSDSDVLSVAA